MKTKRPHVVVVGSLNMDLVVQMPSIPKPGETLLGGRFETFPGGKGANQAVAAARLGAQVTLIGRVGDDAFGKQLIETARREGINVNYICVDHTEATGVALITVDAQGQNSISVASGANFTLTAQQVKNAFDQLDSVDLLVMPLETPLETIEIAAQLAKRQNAQIILNPAPARELSSDLLELVDIIIPNEHETAFMTGIDIQDEEDEYKAAATLLTSGVGCVVLTLGSQGAVVLEGTPGYPEYHRIQSFDVEAVDTTAAGDAFVGALATGMGEGMALLDAAWFANAAAGISVTRPGAQPSLPTRQEVEDFLNEWSL
jgi:ribokinase